jgi:cation:H+ antiporter
VQPINGDLDLAIGNIVGSNIANSLLVVAVLFLAIPKDFNKKIKINQTSPLWMAVVTTIFVSTYIYANNFPLGLGVVLLILIVYITYKMVSSEGVEDDEMFVDEKKYIWLRGFISLAATLYGSQLVVDNAVKIAEIFGVSSLVIGSTIIAIGTSLPEVAGTIAAAKLRKPDLVFGNIFGSNLFNIGLVGGVAIVVSPGGIEKQVDYQLFLMYFVSILVIFLSRNTLKKNPLLGYLLMGLYVLFLVSLF